MRKFTLEERDIYVSEELFHTALKRFCSIYSVHDFIAHGEFAPEQRNLNRELGNFMLEQLEDVFDESELSYEKYLQLYGESRDLGSRCAILYAHGTDEDGAWTFQDEEEMYDVQDWVDGHDGNYAGLILIVCNPGAYTPQVKKSALFLSDRLTGAYKEECDFPVYGVVLPEQREVDSYTLDGEIHELESQLSMK